MVCKILMLVYHVPDTICYIRFAIHIFYTVYYIPYFDPYGLMWVFGPLPTAQLPAPWRLLRPKAHLLPDAGDLLELLLSTRRKLAVVAEKQQR